MNYSTLLIRRAAFGKGRRASSNGANFFAKRKHQRLTAIQAATALRPFYFAVHPDLFGLFPEFSKINENSLKLFNGYLDSFYSGEVNHRFNGGTKNGNGKPARLKFYLRPKQETIEKFGSENIKNEHFKVVELNLKHKDAFQFVKHVLETCNMSTDHLPAGPDPISVTFMGERQYSPTESDEFLRRFWQTRMKKPAEAVTLESRLKTLSEQSDKNKNNYEPYRLSFLNTVDELKQNFHLENVVWDCGWSLQFGSGYLFMLKKMANTYPGVARNMAGWVIRFGSNGSFISVDKCLVLGVEDTPENWYRILQNLRSKSDYFDDLTALESELGRCLNGIAVSSFSNESLSKYKSWLKILIEKFCANQLSTEELKNSIPNLDFAEIDVVVTNPYCPLMIDHLGRFLLPVSSSADYFLKFLLEKYEESIKIKQNRRELSAQIEDLKLNAQQHLNLLDLTWDEFLQLESVAESLEEILKQDPNLYNLTLLKGKKLKFSQSFKTEFDGTICVPVDWLL